MLFSNSPKLALTNNFCLSTNKMMFVDAALHGGIDSAALFHFADVQWLTCKQTTRSKLHRHNHGARSQLSQTGTVALRPAQKPAQRPVRDSMCASENTLRSSESRAKRACIGTSLTNASYLIWSVRKKQVPLCVALTKTGHAGLLSAFAAPAGHLN